MRHDSLTPPALLPPPEGQWYSMAMIGDAQNNYRVKLTRVWMDPTSKNDCKNDGFKKFNFRNQGLCVSYIETGKDSRYRKYEGAAFNSRPFSVY